MAHVQFLDFEACKDEPNPNMPPPDNTLSSLERQGFASEVTDNTWKYKLGVRVRLDSELRNKVNFDTNPTNPQVDIIATGHCEFWVMDIDLVKPTPKNTHPLRPPHQTDPPSPTTTPPPLILPNICTSKVACIYDATGKCKGMLTPNVLTFSTSIS